MNSFVLSGFVLATLFAIGFSELCTPDQWQGYEASVGGYVFHRRPGFIMERNFVAYDAKNKRKASFISYRNNDFEDNFKVIIRYDGDVGTLYYVDLKKKECSIKKWDKPFRKACLPDNAKEVCNYTIGPMDGGLKVFQYEVKKEDTTVYMAVVKSGDVIIPVTENVHGNFMHTSYVQGIQYADIIPTIKDETVFEVPKECNEKFDGMASEFLTNEQFILAV